MNHQTKAMLMQRLEDNNIRKKLKDMESNPKLNTRGMSFSANTELYPDGQMPFVDKHMAYLMQHPKLDPEQYLANLRLMLKQR